MNPLAFVKVWSKNQGTFSIKYPWALPAIFFILGFIFDLVTLGRIDDFWTITQQAVFLFILTLIIFYECVDQIKMFHLPRTLDVVWHYREEIIHFMFGGLLSAYTIFYFKSSSALSTIVFLGFMLGILIANELPLLRKLGLAIRFALLSLCWVSFWGYVVPILWKSVGILPLLFSIFLTILIMGGLAYLLWKKTENIKVIKRDVILPSASVLIIFLLLYILGLIPPVPISIQYIGVYHGVERVDGKYLLAHSRPWWKVWHNGDQHYYARKDDVIYLFARIFSPSQFEDKIIVHWFFYDPRHGWETRDTIPFSVRGGRSEGFRGIAQKKHYSAGDWRVQVETSDGREIGRITFTVYEDSGTETRSFLRDVQ